MGEEENYSVVSEEEKPKAELEKSLEEALTKNEEYLEMLQRLAADFENYKKRMVREREELLNFAESDIILQMLPVLDDLERALAHEKNDVLSMLYLKLKKILSERGLEEVENKTFDPYYHEAIGTLSDPEKEEDAIVDVLKKGYRFRGKVLRHSQVIVNRKMQEKKEEGKEEDRN